MTMTGPIMTGPELIEATRRGDDGLVEMVMDSYSAGQLEDVHVSAILATEFAKQGQGAQYDYFMDAVVQATNYGGFRVCSQKPLDWEVETDGDIELILRMMDGTQGSIKGWVPELLERYLDPSSLVNDTHMAAFLATVMVKGLDHEETVALTDAMWKSGKTLEFPELESRGFVSVDKHSTGGLGDYVSLVLAPLIIAAQHDVYVAMMSGRGLAHTGGTLDKLASIPGFRVDLSDEEIVRYVTQNRFAIFEQTDSLDPADRALYALRSKIACVTDESLITGSIASKKLAAGVKHLVMEATYGSGAFLGPADNAARFAKLIADVSGPLGMDVHSVVTNMDEPLGTCVGNKLEIAETVEVLRGLHSGNEPGEESRLLKVVYRLAGEMIDMARPTSVGYAHLSEVIGTGEAYGAFMGMVNAQGDEASRIFVEGLLSGEHSGDSLASVARRFHTDVVERVLRQRLKPQGDLYVHAVTAQQDGYLAGMDLTRMGMCMNALGAGRSVGRPDINPDVGGIYTKRIGDQVTRGDRLAVLVHDGTRPGVLEEFGELYRISETHVRAAPLIERVAR